MPTCSVKGCDKAAVKKTYCDAHYARVRRHGDANTGRVKVGVPLQFFEAAKSSNTNECILWPYATRGAGRGAIYFEGKTHKVHRLMCQHVNGPAPEGKPHAAHECGNGNLGCINPRHLTWKSPAENEADKIRHGTPRRVQKPIFQVERIVSMRETMAVSQIAKAMGCSVVTIYNYLKRHHQGLSSQASV